jgi:hypothetical protein
MAFVTRSIPGSINRGIARDSLSQSARNQYYDRAAQNVETPRIYEEADVVTCPNCGTQNEPGAHFCAECGANLGSLTSASNAPQPAVSAPSDRPVWIAGQGWVKGVQLPVESAVEPPAPQRTWLRAVLLAIAILLVLCCVSGIYFNSSRGTDQLNRLSTWSAEHK